MAAARLCMRQIKEVFRLHFNERDAGPFSSERVAS